MPIRPEERARYPANWPSISAEVRVKAGNRCQSCGVPNYALGGRLADGTWCDAVPTGESGLRLTWPREGEFAWCAGEHRLRIVKIVLTVAHLNHQPEDNRPENLKALCQRCHLQHDRAHHRETKRKRRAMGDLFR